MNHSSLRGQCWRFDAFTLDGTSMELRRDRQPLDCEPSSMSLLLLFLHHPQALITKDEIEAVIWPGRILSESVLTKCMSRLRKTLGDDAQTLILTMHRRGYRFMATVENLGVIGQNGPLPALRPVSGNSPPARITRQELELQLADALSAIQALHSSLRLSSEFVS